MSNRYQHHQMTRQFSRAPIWFYPIYRRLVKSTTAALLLNHLVHLWFERYNENEFYITDKELMKNTCMSIDEIATAKRHLSKFVDITRKGVPARSHYVIDIQAIEEAILSYGESPQLDMGNPHNCLSGIPITIKEDLIQEDLSKKKDMNMNTDRPAADPCVSIHKYTPEFESLWKLYLTKCKKGSKPKAFNAYKRVLRENKTLTNEKLLEILKAQFSEIDMKLKRKEWVPTVPHLVTWLNGERFDDELEVIPEAYHQIKPPSFKPFEPERPLPEKHLRTKKEIDAGKNILSMLTGKVMVLEEPKQRRTRTVDYDAAELDRIAEELKTSKRS